MPGTSPGRTRLRYSRRNGPSVWSTVAPNPVPGIAAASVLYDAGFHRSVIITRLQDAIIMRAMGESRPFTEEEAIAAYDAIAE